MKIKNSRIYKILLVMFSCILAFSVSTLSVLTAKAASYSVTELGAHEHMAKFVIGNYANWGSGSLEGYCQSCELSEAFSPYFLIDGMEVAEYEAANPGINVAVNRYTNWLILTPLQGVLPEYTTVTLKKNCPIPYAGDNDKITYNDSYIDKDYSLVWADGTWTEPTDELKVSTFSEFSAPVVNGDYTDVTMTIPFSVEIIDSAKDNLTSTANTNVRDGISFDGKKLSSLTSSTPSGDEVTVPTIGASSRFLTLTFRMKTSNFDMAKIERKELKVASGAKMPNYSAGFLGWGKKGQYEGDDVSRYYIAEAKTWIRSYVEKVEVDYNDASKQLWLDATDSSNYQVTYNYPYYFIPIKFAGTYSVLPAGANITTQYNFHPNTLYTYKDRTSADVDYAIGSGFYTSLLNNISINGVKLSDGMYYGSNRVRVDYYPNYMMLMIDGHIDPINNETVVTLGGELSFPSGMNMGGREVQIIFRPGKRATTNVNVEGVYVEGGFDTIEESKANPVDIAVNQQLQIKASTIPQDAAVSYLTYEIVEQSSADIVKLSKKGVLTTSAGGTVTVKVDALGGDGPGTYKYVTYRISDFPLESISLAKSSENISVGATIDLEIYYTPYNASYKDLIFTSSDPSIADVDANGRVTAKKGGTATITIVSAHNSAIKTEFKVTVTKRPVGITVTKPTKVLYALGDRFDTTGMVIEVIYDDNTRSKIPLTLATITGYAGDKLGEQYINVIYDGFYDSFVINVVEELPKEPEPAKTGCVGSIEMMAFALLPTLAGAALVAFKKKEN